MTKITSSPTFRQDQCIAAVQHVNSAGTVIKNGWNFHNSDDYGDWDTTYSEISGTSTAGLEGGDDISTPSLAMEKLLAQSLIMSTELMITIDGAESLKHSPRKQVWLMGLILMYQLPIYQLVMIK